MDDHQITVLLVLQAAFVLLLFYAAVIYLFTLIG